MNVFLIIFLFKKIFVNAASFFSRYFCPYLEATVKNLYDFIYLIFVTALRFVNKG